MASLFRSFSNALLKRPLATQCVTSAVLFASGDIIAQQAIERKSTKHDFSRTARLTFFGGCLFGPPVSKWIAFLSRLQFATPTKAVIYRTWLDQTFMAPVVLGGFFTSMSLLEGKGVSGVMDSLNTKFVPTLMRGWAVYTPAQIVNFGLVPPQFRFVFISIVSLVWNTYLSVVNARLGGAIDGSVD
ncbi:hypothetical protein F5148DRAFT_73861 [Russula earlei]|uniref:Uncharacterized protein n=1 Tax=Russula earlei TaxID=71964 RepID=A0ACC0U7V5_9AGAM|nr:hypothetical protein F5148DRAFT_73861 [Russula earlei]